jgi:hypothetical protein
MKKVIATVAVSAVLVTGGVAIASTGVKGHHGVEFYKVTQDYGTNGIQRFRILGQGCLRTEDVTKLRLVSYDPSHHKVVYRCVQP